MGIRDLAFNIRGLFAPYNGATSPIDAGTRDVLDETNALLEYTRMYEKAAADSMASDVTAATYFAYIDRASEVVSARFVPNGTATANATTYGTYVLNKHDGAGGSATVVGSFATDTVTTDNIAAGVPKALTLVAAAVTLTAGQVLSFQITKASTGVALPAGRLEVVLRKR